MWSTSEGTKGPSNTRYAEPYNPMSTDFRDVSSFALDPVGDSAPPCQRLGISQEPNISDCPFRRSDRHRLTMQLRRRDLGTSAFL